MRKINAPEFLEVLLQCANEGMCCSLSHMSMLFQANYGIKVSRNAIDKRFSPSFAEFVKQVLGEILKERYEENLCAYGDTIFAPFKRVLVKDSTKFQLPESLKDDFPGMGGSSSEAGVGIQFEYDIKNGDITHMDVGKGTRNDHEDAAQTCGEAQEGDLIIRDLGYFALKVFRAFVEHGAYFLSKLNSQLVVVVDKGRKRLSFRELYRDMLEKGMTETQITVLAGGGSKPLKVRLMAQLVPNEVYEQRVRRRKAQNHLNPHKRKPKSGLKEDFQIKDETKARYRFNLLVTNADDKMLPLSKAFPLYRARWQVELCFKSWKGTFRVDEVHAMKKDRFLAHLYAKLILVAIGLQVAFRVQAAMTRDAEMELDKDKKRKRQMKNFPILSINKALKTLHSLFRLFQQMMRGRGTPMPQADKIQEILSRNHLLEWRKNKLAFPQILELFSC